MPQLMPGQINMGRADPLLRTATGWILLAPNFEWESGVMSVDRTRQRGNRDRQLDRRVARSIEPRQAERGGGDRAEHDRAGQHRLGAPRQFARALEPQQPKQMVTVLMQPGSPAQATLAGTLVKPPPQTVLAHRSEAPTLGPGQLPHFDRNSRPSRYRLFWQRFGVAPPPLILVILLGVGTALLVLAEEPAAQLQYLSLRDAEDLTELAGTLTRASSRLRRRPSRAVDSPRQVVRLWK